MVDANYDEVTNSYACAADNLDPMFHWDVSFPEKLSRLHLNSELCERSPAVVRRHRRPKDRCAIRYKTQPVTFDEITEVDEESAATSCSSTVPVVASGSDAQTKANFKSQMTGFSRSMDGLVAGFKQAKQPQPQQLLSKSGLASGSDKENSPYVDRDKVSDKDSDRGAGVPEDAAADATEDGSKSSCGQKLHSLEGVSLPPHPGFHKRKRSNRNSRLRNSVIELPEKEKSEESSDPAC